MKLPEQLTAEQSDAIVQCLRIFADLGEEVRLERERAIAGRTDLETGQRGFMPRQIKINAVQSDENTRYLGGPEGTIWVQTEEGHSYIVAARNEAEIQIAERTINKLIEQGIVPYGFPLNQKGISTMFDETPTSDCIWLSPAMMPPPRGAPSEILPTHVGVFVE